MKLAIGRFEPEMLSESSLFPVFDGIELDLSLFFKWPLHKRRHFDRWIAQKGAKVITRIGLRPSREPEEIEEMFSEWNASYSEVTLYHLLYSGNKAWSEMIHLSAFRSFSSIGSFYCEWGMDDDSTTTAFLINQPGLRGYVVDPSWHRWKKQKSPRAELHFKLHGWHEQRWIRRYGIKQIEDLIKKIRLHPSQHEVCLTLSYSGKRVEADSFKTLL